MKSRMRKRFSLETATRKKNPRITIEQLFWKKNPNPDNFNKNKHFFIKKKNFSHLEDIFFPKIVWFESFSLFSRPCIQRWLLRKADWMLPIQLSLMGQEDWQAIFQLTWSLQSNATALLVSMWPLRSKSRSLQFSSKPTFQGWLGLFHRS